MSRHCSKACCRRSAAAGEVISVSRGSFLRTANFLSHYSSSCRRFLVRVDLLRLERPQLWITGDESGAALEGDVVPKPVQRHDEPVSEADQKIDVCHTAQ